MVLTSVFCCWCLGLGDGCLGIFCGIVDGVCGDVRVWVWFVFIVESM